MYYKKIDDKIIILSKTASGVAAIERKIKKEKTKKETRPKKEFCSDDIPF